MLLPEPPGFGRRDAVWDVPWLSGLRSRVPKDATWPRLMTVPHPRAVDSLGREVAAWVRRRRGRGWRWWQRLAATRILEVDVDGQLVWGDWLLTVSRQVGKTWLVGDLCEWRLEQGDRFEAEQLVLSTGKDVAVVREMQRPARMRAKLHPERWKVREVNGQEEIELLADSSRWMVRSRESVYGYPASLATVDEAWKVSAAVVEEGVEPTMVEQPQSQLGLVSTAHRRATVLMIGRRQSALERLGDPGEDATLLLEWSAPRGAALDDRAAWRLASPSWSPRRERLIAKRLERALAGESDDPDEPDPIESFRGQWLNQWPAKRIVVERGDELVTEDAWAVAACDVDSEGPLVISVEDHLGQGAAIAFCGTLPDGRWVLGGWLCDSRGEAYVTAAQTVELRPGSMVVVGASLFGDAALDAIAAPVEKATRAEVGPALTLLRDLLGDGLVTHDGSADLTAQVSAARVSVTAGGVVSLVATAARGDLLRAAVWALRVMQHLPQPAVH